MCTCGLRGEIGGVINHGQPHFAVRWKVRCFKMHRGNKMGQTGHEGRVGSQITRIGRTRFIEPSYQAASKTAQRGPHEIWGRCGGRAGRGSR